MSSGFDHNAILKTKPGQLRIAAVAVGLFAVAFSGAGHDHQQLLEYDQPDCSSKRTFFRCPQLWMAKLGLALIIMGWLFTIVMLIVSALPSLSQNPQVRKADSFGHIGAGVMAFLGGILCIVWIVTLFLARHCDSEEVELDGVIYKFPKEHAEFCSDGTWGEADLLKVDKHSGGPSGLNYRRSAQVRGKKGLTQEQAIANQIYLDEISLYNRAFNGKLKLGMTHWGAKGWLWIAGGAFAFIFGGLCIVIFVMSKKAGPRGPMMMGGMTQQPSQAPMSMHPSQMTQQQQMQQNPDQQSMHPSQMTQQQG